MNTLLSAKNISKIYNTSAGDVLALNNISLQLEEGLFYAIIGRSGSGKSTLLHILSGLDQPTNGAVFLDGIDFSKYSDEKMAIFRRRYIGFIFQKYNLMNDFDILTNLCLPTKLDAKRINGKFFKQVTEHLELSQLLSKYPSELSGGEQQKVAVARSILMQPKLIFADEPTGNLDKESSEKVTQLLLQCSGKYGLTVITATHDLSIAQKADRIIHLEDGKIVKPQYGGSIL